ILGDDAEEAVRFIGDAGGEIDSATKREQIPQAIELERRAIGSAQRFQEGASRGIVVVDSAVAEIADPEFAVHQGESPRRIQIPVRDDAPKKVAARVERIDETIPGPGNFI